MRFCVVVLVFFALLRSASAQIVNVQPLLGKDLRDGWTVYGEGALDYRTGNVSLLQTTGSAVVRFVRDRHTVFLLTRGEYGVRNLGATNDKFLARHFEHVRYRLRVWRPYDVELFAQNDSDQFRRLATRVITGGGFRVKLVTASEFDAALAALYMFEFQELAHDKLPDHGQRTTEHRISAYMIVTAKVGDRLRLGEAVYYQPRLDRLRDMRILSESELLVSITRYFGLKLTATLSFDTSPPLGVKSLDTQLKAAVTFTY